MQFIEIQDKSMPRAKGAGLRHSIVEGQQKGKTLHQLAAEYQVSYTTVQTLCSRYKTLGESGLNPRYKACGKKRPGADDFIFRAVRCMKAWHPKWGAEKIRSEMLMRRPDLIIPPCRTLQQWFHYTGQAKKQNKQPQAFPRWATAVHEGWQIDAKEEMQTLDGIKNCWLNIKDEHSGAVIDPPVFPL
ncbi:MAG: helix-turn-helix domain-containing protein [Saprospiraceae bacterium]